VKVARPAVVSIRHKLGKDEAIRRMKAGLGSVKTGYGQLLQLNEEIWSGDRLAFRVTALKQQASGTIGVSEDHVRLEVTLPWLLAGLAHGAQANPRARSAHAGEEIVQPRVMAPEADMGTSMRSPSFKNIEKTCRTPARAMVPAGTFTRMACLQDYWRQRRRHSNWSSGPNGLFEKSIVTLAGPIADSSNKIRQIRKSRPTQLMIGSTIISE
jgi:hypothetical protein